MIPKSCQAARRVERTGASSACFGAEKTTVHDVAGTGGTIAGSTGAGVSITLKF